MTTRFKLLLFFAMFAKIFTGCRTSDSVKTKSLEKSEIESSANLDPGFPSSDKCYSTDPANPPPPSCKGISIDNVCKSYLGDPNSPQRNEQCITYCQQCGGAAPTPGVFLDQVGSSAVSPILGGLSDLAAILNSCIAPAKIPDPKLGAASCLATTISTVTTLLACAESRCLQNADTSGPALLSLIAARNCEAFSCFSKSFTKAGYSCPGLGNPAGNYMAAMAAVCDFGSWGARQILCNDYHWKVPVIGAVQGAKSACKNAIENTKPITLTPCATSPSVQSCDAMGVQFPIDVIEDECMKVVITQNKTPPAQQGTCMGSCIERTLKGQAACMALNPAPQTTPSDGNPTPGTTKEVCTEVYGQSISGTLSTPVYLGTGAAFANTRGWLKFVSGTGSIYTTGRLLPKFDPPAQLEFTVGGIGKVVKLNEMFTGAGNGIMARFVDTSSYLDNRGSYNDLKLLWCTPASVGQYEPNLNPVPVNLRFDEFTSTDLNANYTFGVDGPSKIRPWIGYSSGQQTSQTFTFNNLKYGGSYQLLIYPSNASAPTTTPYDATAYGFQETPAIITAGGFWTPPAGGYLLEPWVISFTAMDTSAHIRVGNRSSQHFLYLDHIELKTP